MSKRQRIRADAIVWAPLRIVSKNCYLFAAAITVKLYDESRVLETVAIFSARVFLTRCLCSYRIQTTLRIRIEAGLRIFIRVCVPWDWKRESIVGWNDLTILGKERERERVFKKYIHTYISRNGININRCVRLYRILVIKKPFEFPQNSKQ